MKKLLFLLFPIIFAACNGGDKKPGSVIVTPIGDTTRIIDTTIIEPGVAPIAEVVAKKKPHEQKIEKISCNQFGLKKFNTKKRTDEDAPGGIKGRKHKPGTDTTPPPPPPPPPPPTGMNVIYLNFMGKIVSNTMWNVNGTFTVGDAGLGQTEIDQVVAGVREHYKIYNVDITTDPAVFAAAPIGHKIEVVITEDWAWYGQAGGVAYIGSSTWTDGSPAFVFSTLLNYSSHNIEEAASHEAGHTFWLRHQSDCLNGVLTNQYSLGKVMGNSYYVSYGLWVVGPNPFCASQDDDAMLTAALGLRQ